ncbi:hypothetical protein UK23_40360 [Lentzea aerocolonigenes]|uniref:Uncharacterized protein n=1 Tax=Lentzea aerocolonigenes TaxID=68170 RepID=A0A0F0GGZ6_LENAE|nr:hypothetical protein [Lentzea aerocolonigenes]KJK40476.1 hypothetical protein UK23_40360 [Lentzea aerocolonigenes]
MIRWVVRVAVVLAVAVAGWLFFGPTKVNWEHSSGGLMSEYARVRCGNVFTEGPHQAEFEGVDAQCRAAELPKLLGGVGLLVLAGAGVWVGARASGVRDTPARSR